MLSYSMSTELMKNKLPSWCVLIFLSLLLPLKEISPITIFNIVKSRNFRRVKLNEELVPELGTDVIIFCVTAYKLTGIITNYM